LRLGLERARAARPAIPRRLIDRARQGLDESWKRAARARTPATARSRGPARGRGAPLQFFASATPESPIRRAALAAAERRLVASGNVPARPSASHPGGLAGKLDALSPLKVLDRGYSLGRGAGRPGAAKLQTVCTRVMT